jgi:hypothetical protein
MSTKRFQKNENRNFLKCPRVFKFCIHLRVRTLNFLKNFQFFQPLALSQPYSRPQPEAKDGDPCEAGSHPPPERPESRHHQEWHRCQRRRGAAGRHLHRGKTTTKSKL